MMSKIQKKMRVIYDFIIFMVFNKKIDFLTDAVLFLEKTGLPNTIQNGDRTSEKSKSDKQHENKQVGISKFQRYFLTLLDNKNYNLALISKCWIKRKMLLPDYFYL